MTAITHGAPCWYELSTDDIAAAQRFYSATLGWTVADAGMPGMDYRLAKAGSAMVAGLTPTQGPEQPSAWTLYFAVDNCDATFAEAIAAGSTQLVPPSDIPNTGRFALVVDPQGAAFGILQPSPMQDGSQGGNAFDQQKMGHGNWHELITPTPEKALEFYGKLFGWTVARSMPMGPEMIYHIISWNGVEIGGAFSSSEDPQPYWKPYFGTESAAASINTVTGAGGTVLRGPDEVPGGAFTVQCKDPQGARFALVGPK